MSGGRGGCLCGAVRYRATAPLRDVVACHCSQCRRTHGGFGPYSAVAADALVLDEDRGLSWFASSPGAERGFCRRCGSSLFWKPRFKDTIAISAGSLDEPTGLRLVRHVYTADKADWYEIADGVRERLAGGQDEDRP